MWGSDAIRSIKAARIHHASRRCGGGVAGGGAGAAKLPTIGYLGGTSSTASGQITAAFLQRLRELGWIDGRNVRIEYRWPEGRIERAREIIAEFVRLKVDVILATGEEYSLVAKQATSTIPIVFALAGDPVALAWPPAWPGPVET